MLSIDAGTAISDVTLANTALDTLLKFASVVVRLCWKLPEFTSALYASLRSVVLPSKSPRRRRRRDRGRKPESRTDSMNDTSVPRDVGEGVGTTVGLALSVGRGVGAGVGLGVV